MAESIEIVNLQQNEHSYSISRSANKPKSQTEDSEPEDKLNTSKSDWTETYKEIFESKDLFVIRGIERGRD